jgi:hypothetical protein
VPEDDHRPEVARRLGRPFADVQQQLEEMFDREWDEVVVVIETAALKSGRSHADVIVDLVERSERKPPVQSRLRRSLIRWIGKPWRERENPWDRFKDRVPPPPPRTDAPPDDLDEWAPRQIDDE